MIARVLMVQGTASSVGKSIFVAGVCRLFARSGLHVTPFKAQNMALNAAVTPEGGEIGRSTALQAYAAGIAPHVDMNPVLLKPEPGMRSQIVLLGRPVGHLDTASYAERKQHLWMHVVQALERLRSRYDLVVIEGAGSPAEINLRDADIVNMRIACYAQAPVLLIGDINLGGVFAHLYGTVALLPPEERALIRGFVINKFRGDEQLLTRGLNMLEELTHIPVLAVLPYLANLALPEEDAVALEQVKDRPLTTTSVDIAVCQLPHIANFDDFDLLAAEPGVRLRFVRSTAQVGHPDLIILPGSKATVADLHWLEETGLAGLFVALNGRGVPILGICGGYQMLGERILDPEQVETIHKETAGLGLLQASTTFVGEKHTVNVTLERGLSGPFAAPGLAGNAYEIHMGRTVSQDPPLFTIRDAQGKSHHDGSWNAERAVCGTYLHGLFESRDVRHVLLRWLGQRRGLSLNAIAEDSRDVTLNRLADLLEERIGTSRLLRIADGATNG